MNAVKFGMFVNYLTKLGLPEVTLHEMQAIHDQAQNLNDPKGVSCEAVDELLREMHNPSGIIPAIKAYRSLTGVGLKEAKDAVERYRNVK